jgi:hypothetical protein
LIILLSAFKQCLHGTWKLRLGSRRVSHPKWYAHSIAFWSRHKLKSFTEGPVCSRDLNFSSLQLKAKMAAIQEFQHKNWNNVTFTNTFIVWNKCQSMQNCVTNRLGHSKDLSKTLDFLDMRSFLMKKVQFFQSRIWIMGKKYFQISIMWIKCSSSEPIFHYKSIGVG